MKFYIEKCKVLHIENNNHYTKYTMNGSELSKVSHEKDLGVTISNDLKPRKHYKTLVRQLTNNWLRRKKNFEYKSEKGYPYTI